ncbi:carbonic anhydrase protein [Rutstroemia sp. NJR-2017a WRK4]|nr:carbonic anhydrase protein [Rutstroemia sp. NJR-2017a WRK4]
MYSLFATACLIGATLACPGPEIPSRLGKRADATTTEWAYDASYNWAMINPDYSLCQTGTQQSPIQLSLSTGFSRLHTPSFSYSTPFTGTLYNWGYGLAFTSPSSNSSAITTHPSLSYDNTTLYLQSWHIHAPADHTVSGDRSKAELHLVHADASGVARAVVGFLVDPVAYNDSSAADSAWFASLGNVNDFPMYNNDTKIEMSLDMRQVVAEVDGYKDFWTYEGSLTSPPCTEGKRWFVAGKVLRLGTRQMQGLLRVSTYSARVEQEIWGHGVNE